jgi:hypothetical protein
MTKIILIAASALIASTVAASAYSPSRGDIDARQQRQLGAIEQGRQTGSITWGEGLKLRSQQRLISRTEAQLAADGKLSARDRRYLNSMQDGAREEIVNEKTDRRRRLWFLPRFGR